MTYYYFFTKDYHAFIIITKYYDKNSFALSVYIKLLNDL